MKKRTIGLIVVAAVVATGLASGVALAAGTGDSPDNSATGPDAHRAVAAAVAETGATRANAVERDSEHGATWEVEVAMPDGSTSDVRLDAGFRIVVVDPDTEGTGQDH
jgi:hypothetical protein